MRRWGVVVTLLSCAVLSAVAAVVSTDAWFRDYFSDAPPISYLLVPVYLPAAATMAALSLLCTAIGAQLLRRRPWRSLLALTVITAAVLLGEPSLAFEQEWLAVATVWAGTAILWSATLWSTRASRTMSPILVPSPAALAQNHSQVTADSSLGSATAETHADAPSWTRPDVRSDMLIHGARATATALVAVVLVLILGLVMFESVGGIQLLFMTTLPDLRTLLYSNPALLAPLVITAAWLTGNDHHERDTTLWRVVVLAALVLATVEPAVGPDGTLSISVLTLIGAFIATTRHRLADRAEAMLSR